MKVIDDIFSNIIVTKEGNSLFLGFPYNLNFKIPTGNFTKIESVMDYFYFTMGHVENKLKKRDFGVWYPVKRQLEKIPKYRKHREEKNKKVEGLIEKILKRYGPKQVREVTQIGALDVDPAILEFSISYFHLYQYLRDESFIFPLFGCPFWEDSSYGLEWFLSPTSWVTWNELPILANLVSTFDELSLISKNGSRTSVKFSAPINVWWNKKLSGWPGIWWENAFGKNSHEYQSSESANSGVESSSEGSGSTEVFASSESG